MNNIINTRLITDYMEKNNLSKTKFCKLCKIDYSVLTKILNNKTNFKICALHKIVKLLKIQLFEIFN